MSVAQADGIKAAEGISYGDLYQRWAPEATAIVQDILNAAGDAFELQGYDCRLATNGRER